MSDMTHGGASFNANVCAGHFPASELWHFGDLRSKHHQFHPSETGF